MFKVSIFYPVKENDWFDMEYYLQKHVPLSRSVFGKSLKGLAIEEAYNDEKNETYQYLYKVIGHLFFEKVEDFYLNFLPNEELLRKDSENYTNVDPILQICRVIVCDHYE